jgi:hypothetical protein
MCKLVSHRPPYIPHHCKWKVLPLSKKWKVLRNKESITCVKMKVLKFLAVSMPDRATSLQECFSHSPSKLTVSKHLHVGKDSAMDPRKNYLNTLSFYERISWTQIHNEFGWPNYFGIRSETVLSSQAVRGESDHRPRACRRMSRRLIGNSLYKLMKLSETVVKGSLHRVGWLSLLIGTSLGDLSMTRMKLGWNTYWKISGWVVVRAEMLLKPRAILFSPKCVGAQ